MEKQIKTNDMKSNVIPIYKEGQICILTVDKEINYGIIEKGSLVTIEAIELTDSKFAELDEIYLVDYLDMTFWVYQTDLSHKMKTNLKDNIWIEGFDTDYELDGELDWFTHNPCYDSDDILYFGFTSEILDKFANKCVCSLFNDSFRDYSKNGVGYESFPFETPKESILSACDKPYCIIYKTNNK